MMQRDQVQDPSGHLDINCLKTCILNYSKAEELKVNPEDSEANSRLRSWASGIWRFGSHVLFRSDPNNYSLQLLQLLSQFGSGWISVQLSDISDQGSLQRSLSFLAANGLILMDIYRERIKIQGLNLVKEIQKKYRFDVRCDLDRIQDLFRLLNTPICVRTITPSRYNGLTFTLILALSTPQIKLTPEFEAAFAMWLSELLRDPSHELNHGEKWVMSVGIKLYEADERKKEIEETRSLHYRSLEILFLLRSGSMMEGLDYDLHLDLIMGKAWTYMTLAKTRIRSILKDPSQEILVYFPDPNYPNYVEPDQVPSDYTAVGESLRKLILTQTLTPAILEQLTAFFMFGWNSWKDREQNCDEGKLGSVCFAGILDCLMKQGRTEDILTFVRGTNEYLSRIERLQVNQFKIVKFFPEVVMGYALSLGPESATQKESLLLELESYLMGIYNVYNAPHDVNNPQRSTSNPGHLNERRKGQVVFPHMFKCLVQLGRYQILHTIMTDQINACLQNWTTDVKLTRIDQYVNLPSALAASVNDVMDIALKRVLLEETFGFAQTLVKMTFGLGGYEERRRLIVDPMHGLIIDPEQGRIIDPMGGLINFCFETGMVHELTRFFEELKVSLVVKYGNRIGPITTTLCILVREWQMD